MDSTPVVQGIEFPTPQNSICYHSSPNNPATPVQTHSTLKKPRKFPIFSGSDPLPKDEASYDQWVFQGRGAMIFHSVATVKSGTVNSV